MFSNVNSVYLGDNATYIYLVGKLAIISVILGYEIKFDQIIPACQIVSMLVYDMLLSK